ncbi:MAG: anti-sigma factor antagonist [Spirochaetes bacterium]|nr:anti-sigma factor antagonist [Spirochaetota bacterium]
MDNSILYGIIDRKLYIKIVGECRHNNGLQLKVFMEDCFKLGQSEFDSIYMDLSEAIYIDSTILGILIWGEKQTNELFNSHLFLLKPHKNVFDLLKSGGVLFMFTIEDSQLPEKIEMKILDELVIDKLETAKIIYLAHSELMKTNENQEKDFDLVSKILKKEIDRLESGSE